jgi:hypothetical protein
MLAEAFARKMQEEQARRQEEAQRIQQEQFNRTMRDRAEDRGLEAMDRAEQNAIRQQALQRQQQQDAIAASDRSNEQGTRTMLGDFLTRRQPGTPLNDAERGTLETMAVTDNIKLPESLMAKPQRRLVTTLGKRGEAVQRLASEEELIEGVPEYQEPKSGPAPRQPNFITLVSPDGKQQRRVSDGAEANTLMGQGWRMYDAVAARAGVGEGTPEAAKNAADIVQVATDLKNHPKFNRVFGPIDTMLPTFRSGTSTAEEMRNRLESLLTVDNLDLMKGVLSDSDIKILKQAGSMLSTRINEQAAMKEINRIIEAASRTLTGGGNSGGGSNATVKMKAPDGSVQDVPADQVDHYRSLGAQVVQ